VAAELEMAAPPIVDPAVNRALAKKRSRWQTTPTLPPPDQVLDLTGIIYLSLHNPSDSYISESFALLL
jgi:hypothetical protein